ncbi:MAG: protease modulator HflC [Deltaproteobacteria bacterium]|nr:protease modulator HflC [Deltaproteobacteria bacterium]
MNIRINILAPLLVLGFLLYSSIYIVHQIEVAIEIQLGEPKRVIKEPGLYFKLPLVTEILKFDRRLLLYDSPTGTIITRDKKTMLVDNFARWRVSDPLQFYQSVRNVNTAVSRLDDIIYSKLREILGNNDLEQIVRQREDMLVQVTDQALAEAKRLGIEVVDVRIKRADLPEENSRAVFARMDAERRRIAKRYMSEGEEEALKIRSNADREKTEIISKAREESLVIRGEADAEAAGIYAEAYNQDQEFYSFWRSNEAYRNTLVNDTTLLLTDDKTNFLRYFK